MNSLQQTRARKQTDIYAPIVCSGTGNVITTKPDSSSTSRNNIGLLNGESHPAHESFMEKCLPGQHSKKKRRIAFRPIEGKFNEDKDIVGKIDPYCKFKLGWHKGKTCVARQDGKYFSWTDSVMLKVKEQEYAKVKVKDKKGIDKILGEAKIPLSQVISSQKVTQWIPLQKKEKITGEILIDMEYFPSI